MKKYLILLILFMSTFVYSQVEGVFHIPDSTTTFGKAKAINTVIFDEESGNFWQLTTSALSTSTLETATKKGVAGAGGMEKATYDAASVNEQLVGLTATQELTNKTLVKAILSDTTSVQNVDFNDNNIIDIKGIGFKDGQEVTWDTGFSTLSYPTGFGDTTKVVQNDIIRVHNNTLDTLLKGKVIKPVGSFAGDISDVEYAMSNSHENISIGIGMLSQTLLPDSSGFATVRGPVSGINTSALFQGAVFVSATIPGGLTNIPPAFPNYVVLVGGVSTVDATNGEILISPVGKADDTVINFWNGVFRESFDFMVSSNGSIITGSLTPADSHPNMTMLFSDGFTTLATTPPATISLTAGTDSNPQTNYVYVPNATKVLTVSTASFPEEEHIKVAQVSIQTAATVQEKGALRNQNINDAIEATGTGQGHLSHITERIRQDNAKWDSGAQGSVAIDAGAVYVKATSGVVYQMHKQIFPIIDMTQYSIDSVDQVTETFILSDDGDLTSIFPDNKLLSVNNSTGNDGLYTIVSTNYNAPDFDIIVSEVIPSAVADGTIGDNIYIVNDFAGAYTETIDLGSVTTDATGDALLNTSFSVVVWGVNNKTNEPSHIMANMPTSTYNKNFPEQAVSDAINSSVYSIPKQFQGVGFLIARFTFVDNAGVWSLYDTEDLRGAIPNTTAGGGAGGAGVTSFTGLSDTPNAYSSQALNYLRVASGETALEFIDINTGGALSNIAYLDQANTFTNAGDNTFVGKVGIGIATPDAKLQVSGEFAHLGYSGNNIVWNGSGWEYMQTGYGSLWRQDGTGLLQLWTSDTGTGGTAATPNIRITVDNVTGYVGLNTASPNTTLDVQGGQTVNVTTVGTTTYNVLVTDYIIESTIAFSSTSTITLPTAQIVRGRIIKIKDISAFAAVRNIVIGTQDSQTIDGQSTFTIDVGYGAVTLYSNGSNWFTL